MSPRRADHDNLYGAKASMEPAGLAFSYKLVGSDIDCKVSLDDFTGFSDEAIEVGVSFDGEVVEATVTAKTAIELGFFQVKLRHAFASDEHVLLNGYQSWTDTVEHPAWGKVRGLRHVPKFLVKRLALDGPGDYDQVDYTGRAGENHGFTYATFRRGNGMVLVASLDESHGFTLIRTKASAGEVLLETECPQRELEVGAAMQAGRYVIARGTMKQCYDRWFNLSGIQPRKGAPLVGYTSWYGHYDEIGEEVLLEDLAATKRFFDEALTFKIAPAIKLFQIDDGYCKVGDWHEVNAEKFPRGLAPIADAADDAGFVPGLWIAPFLCERDSRLFAERPEWLLRDERGDVVPTGRQWSGAVALDTRNVEVRSYVLEVLQTITRDWGFKLLKADFLYAACIIAHDGLNRGELMADAIDLLRKGVGEDALILGCGVPLASAFGKVDYCRIGCDVGLDWNDKPHMRLLHRERISTKNSLANTYARAPLDGRAFGNDPDVFFLRDAVKLTDDQRDELLFADADLGSVFLTSDDMSQWDRDMRERYRAALKVFVERHSNV